MMKLSSGLAPIRRQSFLPTFISVAILLIVGVIASTASSHSLSLVLALVPAAAGLFLAFRRPQLWLVLIIPIALLVPLGIRTSSQTDLNIALIVLIGLVAVALFRTILGKGMFLPKSAVVAPLLMFMAVAILSLLVGQIRWHPLANLAPIWAQLGGLSTFILSALALLLAGSQIRDLRILELMTWIFLGVGAVIILGRLIPGLSRLPGMAAANGASGSLLWIWLVALAFGQAVYNDKLSGWRKVPLIMLVLGVFYLNLIGGRRWSSGWIPPLVALLVIIWAGSPKLGAVATAIAAPIAFMNFSRLADFVLGGGNQYSLVTRLEAWRILSEIIRVNPILGLGPANYYWYTPLYPIFGYAVRFNSHNNYVDMIAQIGFVGLAAFAWFVWSIAQLAWRLRLRVPAGFARAYVLAAIGGLAGTLSAGFFGDWIIPFVYNVRLDGMRASILGWLFLGGLVALEQMLRRGSLESLQVARS